MDTANAHTFHIPVMGTGFTIDTPVKVAHYGISSVVSLVDDELMEKMRRFYCAKLDQPFRGIHKKSEDSRARRITAYLDLLDEMVTRKMDTLRTAVTDQSEYVDRLLRMLPDRSALKTRFDELAGEYDLSRAIEWLRDRLTPGTIDVNIMTKVDTANYRDNEQLPREYADAHAALRGFANSNLNASVVLSAGMNPRLYSYIGNFRDFYPDEEGRLKKRITLKVSDYRSARIQGKFLAKKGLWVSEYRIESGLNCGGHAFATDGYLMGPILEEFRSHRERLAASLFSTYRKALEQTDYPVPASPPEITLSAQGGVGNAEEHRFLRQQYDVDSVGWGTPFLLVPEAVNVDAATRGMLSDAEEDDLYLSGISPLGVPFNSLRGNTKDLEKQEKIAKGRPGSPCPRKFITFNTEFTEKSICTASRQYQHLKLQELAEQDLSEEEHRTARDAVHEKACLCVGLSTAPLLTNDLDHRVEGEGVSVCPGPNMAYFSETVSLDRMVDHIYGRTNLVSRTDRPHMFVKELKLYVDYLREKVTESLPDPDEKQLKYLRGFRENLLDGIRYYEELFSDVNGWFSDQRERIRQNLRSCREELQNLLPEKVEVAAE